MEEEWANDLNASCRLPPLDASWASRHSLSVPNALEASYGSGSSRALSSPPPSRFRPGTPPPTAGGSPANLPPVPLHSTKLPRISVIKAPPPNRKLTDRAHSDTVITGKRKKKKRSIRVKGEKSFAIYF